MKNYTHLGDGIFAIVLSLYFIFRNVRIGLLILISYLTSSGITQVLKHFFFSEYNRPYFYFKEDSAFHFIENFNYHAHHSFPSGHATTCFAIFTILAYKNQENIRVQIIFAILAISVAFSRVYLSQHFIQDIIAGSMIGFLCAHFLWLFIYSKLYKLDRALLPKKQNVVKEK
jgi:membrane-associated phospholipid phosphatase